MEWCSRLSPVMLVGPLPAVFIFASGYLGLSKQSTWLRSAAIGFSCAGIPLHHIRLCARTETQSRAHGADHRSVHSLLNSDTGFQ